MCSGKNKPTVETAGFKTASENMRAVLSRNILSYLNKPSSVTDV